MAGERINVSQVVGGKLVVRSIPAEKAAAARDAGWQLASGEETQKYKYEREVMERPGAKFDAGFEGFSRAVTLGLSDAALAKVVSDEERQAMQARSQSDAARTGEILGTGATLLSATGLIRGLGARAAAAEGSALLRGAGKATQLADTAVANTPLGLVMRGSAKVGEAVERKIVGDATAGVARRALARGAGLGVEGGLEGGAIGAAQELSEASLGDQELVGQKLLVSAGRGAIFGSLAGAALGVPLGAASGVAGRVLRRATDDLEVPTSTKDHVAPEIAESLKDKATDLFSTVSSKLSGKSPEEIKFGLTRPDARSDFVKLKEIQEDAVKRSSDTLGKMKGLEKFEKRLAAGDWKAESVAKSIRRGDGVPEMQAHHSNALVEEVANQVKRGDMNRLIGVSNRKEIEFLVDEARRGLRSAARAKDPAVATHQAMETFKRGLADMRDGAHEAKIAARKSTQQRDKRQTKQLANWTDVYAAKTKNFLENTEVWGQAGVAQAERNAAIASMLKTKGDFDGRFFRKMKEKGPGGRVEVVDPQKVDTYFRQLTDWRKDYAHNQTVRHLDDRARLYETLERNGEIPEELAGEFAQAKQLVSQMKADFAAMGERISNANRIRDLAEVDTFDRMTGGAAASVIGAVTGGPIGAAAGFAVDAIRNPGALVQRIGALESLASRVGRVDSQIAGSIRKFVRQETAPELRKLPEREARRKMRTSSAVTAAATGLYGNGKSRAKEVRRRVDAVRAYQADPVLATDSFVRRATRGVGDYAPGVALSVAATHARAMQFLAAKLPPVPRSKLLSLQPDLVGHTLAPSQIEKLAKYMHAIEEPIAIVEDMRTGKLSPEAVEALKAVYPDLWGEMRNVAIAEVVSAKTPISHRATVKLSLLFDFVGTPTLDPVFQATHRAVLGQRAAAEQQAPPPPSARKTPNPLPATQTHSQRLIMNM